MPRWASDDLFMNAPCSTLNAGSFIDRSAGSRDHRQQLCFTYSHAGTADREMNARSHVVETPRPLQQAFLQFADATVTYTTLDFMGIVLLLLGVTYILSPVGRINVLCDSTET